MIRLAEAAVFGAIATGAHLLALPHVAGLDSGGAPASQGAPVEFSMMAPDAAMRRMVAGWQKQPDLPRESEQPAPPDAGAPPAPPDAVDPVVDAAELPPPAATPAIDHVPPPARLAAPPQATRPRARPAEMVRQDRDAGQVRQGSGGVAKKAAPQRSGVSRAALQREYGSAVRAAIIRARIYPAAARKRGMTGNARLRVTISRDGRLLGARVVESSGSALLDQAAVRTAKSAGRFPAAPAALKGQRFEFVIGLDFTLN